MTALPGGAAPAHPLDEHGVRWLRAVLRDDLLSVVFQPIVNLLTGDVVLYEALGRVPLALAGEPDYSPRGPLEWRPRSYVHTAVHGHLEGCRHADR